MLRNEEFALACLQRYAEEGWVVDKDNGEFAHCPLPNGMGESGYYLLHGDHQRQGLYQSEDLGRCCFWVGHTRAWLYGEGFLCGDWFYLVHLYEKWSNAMGRDNGVRTGRRAVKERLGIHDPANSQKVLDGSVKGGLKAGRNHAANKTGLCSAESREKSRLASTRKVEVTFWGGNIGVYPSIRFAAMALGVSITTVQRWASNRQSPYGRRGVTEVRLLDRQASRCKT